MELKFIYPRWGSSHIEWTPFLKKVKENGYEGVEIDLPLGKEKNNILSRLREEELDFVGQHWETKEVNFDKHKEKFKRHLYNLVEAKPLIINSHTGLDFFSRSQNLELIELADEIEKETGVIVTHETHRSRFSFAAHITHFYIKEFPSIKLTSDFSHWCCVAESLLENQEDAVEAAIKRSYHIHARVGSAQSPQVLDPRDKTYDLELKRFKSWWHLILDNALKSGRSFMTITPEFGPFPYAQLHPKTNKVMADQWDVNQFIKSEIMNDWNSRINR